MKYNISRKLFIFWYLNIFMIILFRIIR